MIGVYNLSKKYGDKYIFKNLNYTFNMGLYVIRGKSGKGKSTLLNILSLNDKEYEGKLEISGSLFYLKDRDNLVGDLTVREHLKLFESINNKKIKCIFNIDKLMKKKVKKLSLGEYQLVSLTIALNGEEENLLLDEPFSALSEENLKNICSFLEKESKKRTIILTCHNDNYFDNFININLCDGKKKKNDFCLTKNICGYSKQFKFSYLSIYFKRTIFKKLFFIFSLFSSVFSFFYTNSYLQKNFNEYLVEFSVNEGTIISRKNNIIKLDEELFYEVIKKMAIYVKDYNVNYYNYSLYERDVTIDRYYIDNGFVFSSIKYIEEYLEHDEVVLGLNYKNFCRNNLITNCDINYINKLLVNKKFNLFPYKIKRIFDSEDTVVLSNNRFVKLYDNNDYEQYYFDICKNDKEDIFKIIYKDELLSNFEFTLVGENEEYFRYKVEIKDYKYFNSINYDNYLVCLDKGYNCFDYLNHFTNLVKIDNYENVNNLDLKVTNKQLNVDEIIISSRLSKELGKKSGEKFNFYFKYNDEIKVVKMIIKDVIDDNEFNLYQNSTWSFNFFKDILQYSKEDLRIKNLLIYETIKEDDYVSDNIYSQLIKEFNKTLIKMKRGIFLVSSFASLTSIIILIFLEVHQNKFKKAYFRYMNMLNVNV